MVVSQVCSSVDAIRAFLQHLVDPMLPQKPSIHDDPPLSQQQKIANQVFFSFSFINFITFVKTIQRLFETDKIEVPV